MWALIEMSVELRQNKAICFRILAPSCITKETIFFKITASRQRNMLESNGHHKRAKCIIGLINFMTDLLCISISNFFITELFHNRSFFNVIKQ